MQKKKSETKLNLPSVGIKPTESSKNYGSKNTIIKAREIDERNIYFEMPSIHQNDLSLKAFMDGEERPLHKLQMRILKYFENAREVKMWEEWDLYAKKSEILNNRNFQFSELEEFLVKTIYKIVLRLTEFAHSTSFSYNKSIRTSSNLDYDSKDYSENYNKTACLQDKILDEESKFSNKKLSKNASEEMKEQIDPVNILSQQNVLLEKKADVYEKRIEELTKALAKFEEKQNEASGEKDTTTEMMQAIMAKNKYKYESEVKSMHIQSLSRELKSAKDQASILKIKLEEVESKITSLAEQNTKFKEYLKFKQLWQMATEEVLSWRGKFLEEREEKDRCISKIKLLKDKNKQLLNYFNMSNAVNPDQEEDKQDLDKIIKQFKEWLMIISVPKVASHSYDHQQQPQERLTGAQEVNVKLLKPNFYIFFEAFQNTLLVEKNIINIRPIEYNFFLKIRVIFDTMFRQFLIAKSYKDYPIFPQFVIGFIEKYQVSPETGKVQYRRKPIQNEEKITFLVNLFNKNFCNTWECEIFKNFLFENYYLDEIFFFLECRNEFNGGTPSSNVLGSVDPISYIKLSKALKVVTKQLAPYENYIIEKVKNILKSKKKIKYGEAFIDKHFVLKLLLQVYSLERAKSERIFQSSFTLKMKKSYITFGDFHNFMTRNFSFITSVQVAELYREVYTLSSGHVTHKAIHYICGSKGLFIPLMQQKRANRSGLEKSLSGDMLLLDVQNVITKMIGQLEEFGQQSFMGFEHSINGFMRQLQYYKGSKALFYQRLFQEKCKVLRVNTLIQLASSYELNPGETLEQSQVQTRMIQLHSLLHQADTQVHLLARQKQKRGKAWKMLVRNFKIRIQESILQFEKVNEQEINKLRQQIQTTNLNKEQELEAQLKRQKPSQTRINN